MNRAGVQAVGRGAREEKPVGGCGQRRFLQEVAGSGSQEGGDGQKNPGHLGGPVVLGRALGVFSVCPPHGDSTGPTMCVTRRTEIQGPGWLCTPTGAATSTGTKAQPGVGAGEAELGPLLGHFCRCVCTERETCSQALPGSQKPRHACKHTYILLTWARKDQT